MKIYLLETFDRWDDKFPWDIVGYTDDLKKAEKWVNDASSDSSRRYTEVTEKELI